LETIVFVRRGFLVQNGRFGAVFRGLGLDHFLISFVPESLHGSMYVDTKPAKHVANAPQMRTNYAWNAPLSQHAP
jgi:hypothetical protein